jgi:uncharacterized protein (DUF934 family)
MPLIEDGRPAQDSWTSVPDGEPVPGDIPAIISFERWQAERDSFAGRNTKLGVRLKGGTLASAIAADLDRFALVAVEFPKFRDGRGFSTARELRERYGFEGEIRAVGHVIPDQYLFLKRTGFTSVEAPEGTNLDSWANALTEVSVVYQPGLAKDDPNPLIQRWLKRGGETPVQGAARG